MARLTAFRRALHAATPLLALGIAGATAALAACADAPTGPSSALSVAPSAARQAFVAGPHAVVSSATTLALTLTRTTALPSDISASTTVTSAGGTLTLGQTGLTVRFPAGFVAKPTTFTVTARHGNAVAYDFSPAGTFSAPVTITQQLAGTNWRQVPDLSTVRGGYLQNWSQLVDNAQGDQDNQGSSAYVNEFMPATVSPSAGTISFAVRHFSGYLVSWNRH